MYEATWSWTVGCVVGLAYGQVVSMIFRNNKSSRKAYPNHNHILPPRGFVFVVYNMIPLVISSVPVKRRANKRTSAFIQASAQLAGAFTLGGNLNQPVVTGVYLT